MRVVVGPRRLSARVPSRPWALASGLTLAILASASPVARGQEPPPVFATGVDVVAVDVSVVDKDGRPIRGLGVPDFTLTVGGRPRRIVSVEFVDEGPGAPDAEEPAAIAAQEPTPTDYSTNENARAGRLVLIAVDEGNIQAGQGRGTIAAVGKLLDGLSPVDRVGLITIPGPEPRVEFTTNHATVKEALRTLVGKGHFAGRSVSLTEALAFANADDADKWAAAIARECGPPGRTQDRGCVAMLESEAQSVALSYRQQSRNSLNMLRTLLDVLKGLEGPKTLVLITQGLGEPDSGSRGGYGFSSAIRPVAEGAASARVSLFAVTVNEGGAAAADTNQLRETTEEDRSFHEYGLETLVDEARGVVLRGSPEQAFARIARESSGHYLLGFEPEARERDGKDHKLGVKVARPGATVRAWRTVSLQPEPSPKQQEQSLVASLRAPQPAVALPIRVASYALPDAASHKVRLLVVAELGTSSGGVNVAYVLVDGKDKVLASAVQQTKEGEGNGGRVPFVTSLLVDPGSYTLKLAARDRSGRTGRVDHPVKALITSNAGGEIETGDLLVGPLPAAGTPFRPAVGSEIDASPLVARWDVLARDPGRFQGGEAVIEIATDAMAPTLGAATARLGTTDTPNHRVVQAVLPLPKLAPGLYVVRMSLTLGGHAAATVNRPVRLGAARSSGVPRGANAPADSPASR